MDASSVSAISSIGNVVGVAAIVAALTFVATCYKQIKAAVLSFSDFFIEKHQVSGDTRTMVMMYLQNHFRSMTMNSSSYAQENFRIMSKQSNGVVVFRIPLRKRRIFLKGLKVLFVGTVKADYWCETLSEYTIACTIYYPRWFFNFNQIIKDSLKEYESLKIESLVSKKTIRFAIHRVYGEPKDGGMGGIISMLSRRGSGDSPGSGESNGGMATVSNSYKGDRLLIAARRKEANPLFFNIDDLQNTSIVNVDPFDVFPFAPNIMESVEEAREWKRSERWYLEKHIPWRRGYIIAGEPGVGKTLFIKSLAQSLDMPVYLFDLASMNNQELYEKWDKACADAPCFVVLEDFDNVFHGRTNVCGDSGSKVSFDALLNCISGIKQTNGIFLIITANDMKKLDSAIGLPSPETGQSSRPGRIDKIIMMGQMDEECRRKLASRLLDKPPFSETVNAIVAKGAGLTGAQFSELCNQESLKQYWENKSRHITVHSEEVCR